MGRLLTIVVLSAHVLIVLLGIVIAALGIWVLASDYGMVKLSKLRYDELYSSTLHEPGLLDTGAIICIVVGALMIVFAAVAFHGIRKGHRCLMAVSAAPLATLVLMDIVVVIVTGLVQSQAEDDVQAALLEGIRLHYDGLIEAEFEFSRYFDRAQVLFECCGATSYTNFNQTATLWTEKITFKIPRTCCIMNDKFSYLDNDKYDVANPSCYRNLTSNTFHTKTCPGPITDWIQEKAFILLGVTVVNAVVKGIGSILSIVYLRQMKEDTPYNDL